MKDRHLWGLVASILVAVSGPAAAHACSCGGVSPVVYTANGSVPADLGGFAIWPGARSADSPGDQFVELARWVDDAWVDETADVVEIANPGGFEHHDVLVFVTPATFEEGDRFRVRAGFESERPAPTEAIVDVAAPFNTQTGQLNLVIGEQSVLTTRVAAGTSCDAVAWVATRTVAVDLPSELVPYRDLLLYETTIDGVPWRPWSNLCSPTPIGRSWQGEPGTDLLAVTCAHQYPDPRNEMLSEGSHTVQVHVFLPNGDPVLTSPTLKTELTCPTDCVEYDFELDDFAPCSTAGDAGAAGGTDMGRDLVDAAGSSVDLDNSNAGGCSTTTGSSLFPTLLIALFAIYGRRTSPFAID